MPTYGYKCRECKHEYEVFRKITADPETDCPECGGPIQRVFHPVGIIFKGSGFYTTDYKKKSGEPDPSENKEKPKKEATPDSKNKENKENKKTEKAKP